MTRRTLINILRLAAASPAGLRRERLYRISSCITQKEIDRVLASDWLDKGICGLVSQELIPNYRNKPSRRLFITPAGREFLRRITVNPYAIPDIPRGRVGYMSFEAKMYAQRKARKAQRRRRAQRKYWSVRANPKYTSADYDVVVDLTRLPPIGSPAFKKLSPLMQIRMLRTRVRRRQLQNRFSNIAREVNQS